MNSLADFNIVVIVYYSENDDAQSIRCQFDGVTLVKQERTDHPGELSPMLSDDGAHFVKGGSNLQANCIQHMAVQNSRYLEMGADM